MKRLLGSLAGLLLAGVLALLLVGYAHTPPKYWYPFITALFTDHYTTGPFAMTSNIRDDNPVWPQLPALNDSLGRLGYAMTQGQPDVDIAWLFARQEWPDKPALGEGLTPNLHESPLSRTLVQAGLVYDRISRQDLLRATATPGGRLRVGAMQYRTLLVDDMAVAAPEWLAQIEALAAQGVPVVWVGAMPQRAPGWADAARRDAEVLQRVQALQRRVSHVADASALLPALAQYQVRSPVLPAGHSLPGLRTQRRQFGDGQLVLLFNENDAPLTVPLAPGLAAQGGVLLDPETGAATPLNTEGSLLTLPPRRTRLLKTGPTASWDETAWQHPPQAVRPMVRWWWPGNDVEPAALTADLQQLQEAGFGGVELQTLTVGLTDRQLEQEASAIFQVGTEAYFANVRHVFREAAARGLQVDLTMGSGWPNGGPFIDRYPEQQLLAATVDLTGPGSVDQPLPTAAPPSYVTVTNWIIRDTIGPFDEAVQLEAVVAARVDEATDPPSLQDFTDLSAQAQNGRLRWDVPSGNWRVFAFYRNQARHNLAASAFPGGRSQARVLDHLDPGGVAEYIEELGMPWLAGIAPYKPGAWFIDSFELIGELPWSAPFRQAFLRQHGYDLAPYLPLVFRKHGESKYFNMVIPPSPAYQASDDQATRIREDYELTRETLFREAFLLPLQAWSRAQGIPLRVQAHGGYGDYLDSYQVADIPESEGLFGAGSAEFLGLAASAGHLAGRRVISAESFITMSLDFNALSIDDYHFLAGNAYAAGINRLVFHGHAYRKPMH